MLQLNYPGGMIDVIIMKRTEDRGIAKGFALPTVMIASVVMLMVLLSGLVAASSVNSALRTQHTDKMLRMASESGSAMANACLAKNYGMATWTDPSKPLKPNTDCSGNVLAGVSPYVLQSRNTPTGPIIFRTTFSVPPVSYESGSQRFNVSATLETYRTSANKQTTDNTVTGTLTNQTRSVLVGTQNNFSNVAFGYLGGASVDSGSQFAVVLGTGEIKTLGRNNNGRLGNGTLTDSNTPSIFILPSSERGIAAFSNFLSVGKQFSVLTANGKIYSAGSNSTGQLGNGSTSTSVSTPVQFGTLGNTSQPKAKFVALTNYTTYVMADNNRIYAAGECTSYGMVGNGCTSGTVLNPVLVALPTPTADLNTQPETTNDWVQSTNFTTDRVTAYVRMKGGAVYGWGGNDWGQLGDGTFTNRPSPVRVQALTSSATPSAKQIAFNGNSLYILDTEGLVWATGENMSYGELGGTGAIVRNGGNTTVCLQDDPASTYVLTPACSTGDGMQWMEWWPDGTWRTRVNTGTFRQTDATLCATAPGTLGTTSYVQMLACTGATNQQWQVRADKTIRSVSSGGCIEPYSNLYIIACRAVSDGLYSYQQWTVQNSPYLRPMPMPPGNPKATRISTDNSGVVILYENGDVWAAGGNNRNQLGMGTANMGTYNPVLKKVPLPGPVADIYATDHDPVAPSTGVNLGSHNNSFFILQDGRVFGTGADNYGQLGRGGTTTGDYVTAPVQMQLPAGVLGRTVQAGYGTTIVISTTGVVYTVGNNSNGQLGDGTYTSSSIPKANKFTNQRSSIIY